MYDKEEVFTGCVSYRVQCVVKKTSSIVVCVRPGSQYDARSCVALHHNTNLYARIDFGLSLHCVALRSMLTSHCEPGLMNVSANQSLF